MYSGSNRRLFAGFCFIALFLGAIPASAQSGSQVSMDALELLTYMNYSYVPREEFSRVFKNFVKTSYNGRGYLYQYETRDFFRSFILHVSSGPLAAAWNKYEEQAKATAAEKARAEEAVRAAAAEKARAEAAAQARAAAERAKYAHRLTADTKLYAEQDFNAAGAVDLPRGTAVQLNGYGEYTDLDGDTAKWAQVTTTAGKTGWVFSGFLEERPK